MHLLRRIFLAILGLVLLAAGIAFFLPSTWQIKRTAFINSSQQNLYTYLSDLEKWPHWTTWNKQADPTLKIYPGEQTAGQGAVITWQGDSLGEGHLIIDQTQPPKQIRYTMTLQGKKAAIGSIELHSKQNGTEMIWLVSGDVGMNLAGRLFLYKIDSLLGSDMDFSIARLKHIFKQGR